MNNSNNFCLFTLFIWIVLVNFTCVDSVIFAKFEPTVAWREDMECKDVFDGETSTSLCFVAERTATSSASIDENGTMTPEYVTYNYDFAIYRASDFGLHNPYNVTLERRGNQTYDKNSNDTVCSFVAINGTECNSCQYCGHEKFSADCTNIIYGRVVDCEPADDTLFFPMVTEAVHITEEDPNDGPIDCLLYRYDGSEEFNVCFTSEGGSSSAFIFYDNKTQIEPSFNEYYHKFLIYDDVDGTTSLFNVSLHRSGEVEGIEDRTECDFIAINDKNCTSCSYCGNELYSADCTNLPYGRLVDCESTSTIFFPLNATSLESDDNGSSNVNCIEFSYIDHDSFEVCYVSTVEATRSIRMHRNCTFAPSFETYDYNYAIYNKTDNDDLIHIFNITMTREGEVYEGDDKTECGFVKVGGNKCKSCSYCGNETFSIDCSNLSGGRNVTCESTSPLFFPLTSQSLKSYEHKKVKSSSETSFIIKGLKKIAEKINSFTIKSFGGL